MLSHGVIALMRMVAWLPLAWVRALGWALGWLLYALIPSRKKIAMTNLKLCFPAMPEGERRQLVQQVFVCFAQSWLDRGWLWHAAPNVIRKRLRLSGDVHQLDGSTPTLILAPHFVGLDAGATALSLMVPRQFTTIYTRQSNPVMDAWIAQGRRRFGNARLFDRSQGVKSIIASLRVGEPLYLLPDMDFGAEDCVFVPFYGVPAATIPSLARFARLGRAKVVPVVTRMTRDGYEVCIEPAWEGFPGDDVVADTALMNAWLQQRIDTMPEQYFWVHKRFKTRPPGESSIY